MKGLNVVNQFYKKRKYDIFLASSLNLLTKNKTSNFNLHK